MPRRAVLRKTHATIEKHERLQLSERDSRLVMELLKNPPTPNTRLATAARRLPDRPLSARKSVGGGRWHNHIGRFS
jgi:uncharacterized protein (DUF1778 family)